MSDPDSLLTRLISRGSGNVSTSTSGGSVMASEEIYPNDISIASAALGSKGEVLGAVSIAVSKLRVPAAEAETRFAPLVMAAAQAMSQARPLDMPGEPHF